MAQVKGDCSLDVCPLQQAQTAFHLPEETRRQLANAYAEQGRSDFAVYKEHLQGVEECHRLHFLQMACEKIAKAYRLRDTPSFTEEDLYSHVIFSRFISNLLTSPQIKQRYYGKDATRKHIEKYARGLAQSIERLAPAVDWKGTPSNVEYPWVSGLTAVVPTGYRFAVSEQLAKPDGRNFLNLIEIAITDFSSITLSG